MPKPRARRLQASTPSLNNRLPLSLANGEFSDAFSNTFHSTDVPDAFHLHSEQVGGVTGPPSGGVHKGARRAASAGTSPLHVRTPSLLTVGSKSLRPP
jgi:hypothetical protein